MNQRAEVKRRKKSFWAMLLAVMLVLNSMSIPVRADNFSIPTNNPYAIDQEYIKPGDTITWTSNIEVIYKIDASTTYTDDSSWSEGSDGNKVYTVLGPKAVEASEAGFECWKVTNVDESGGNISSITLSIPTFYTVTFKNFDGEVIASQKYEEGTLAADIVEPVDNPSKPSTEQIAYIFEKWSPDFEDVTQDAVYTATYSEAFIVSFNTNGHGNAPTSQAVKDGEKVTDPGNLSETHFSFEGWYKEKSCQNKWKFDSDTVTSSITLYAKWEPEKCKISFVDSDGTTPLKVNYSGQEVDSVNYDYGTPANSIIRPADPRKADTPEFTYSFNGWDPDVTDVTGEAQYKAKYKETKRKYKVSFVDEDGTTPIKVKDASGNDVDYREYEYGTSKSQVVNPAKPTKSSNERYSYEFDKWICSDNESTIIKDVTYTASYTATDIKYTVKFVDEDGTTPIKVKNASNEEVESLQYLYGTSAEKITKPADPSKNGDAEWSYTFAGWEPAVGSVTGDATYKATYTAAKNKYTVSFVNHDGTKLIPDAEYEYGTTADKITKPGTPSRGGSAEWSYTFKGWNPEVDTVTGDVTYRADYNEIKNKYEVTFWSEKKEYILRAAKLYEYGTAAADIETPEDPVKAATDEWTYTFSGWNPQLQDVFDKADYEATFTQTKNKYTVKFVDEDGTTPIKVKDASGNDVDYLEYDYGTAADKIVKPAAPSKQDTDEYTYSFIAWTPAISEVKGDAIYKANYSATKNKYKVTFVDSDDSILLATKEYDYGTTVDKITKPADPSKSGNAEWTYTFAGWDKEITAVKSDVTYKATYTKTKNKYDVEFVDEDGTTPLKVNYSGQEVNSVKYDYGTAAADIVRPQNPEKAATPEYTYTFAGWTPAIADVKDNATYKATYSRAKNRYTIKFVDYNGDVISSAEYEYGKTAADIVRPSNPSRTATAEYTYSFSGWTPAIADVTGDATYTATYSAAKNNYKVTFVDSDDTVLQATAEYEYGTTADQITKPADPSKAATAEFTYAFGGWNPKVDTVTCDVTYKAVYTATKNKYDVSFVDEDGTTVLMAATPYEYGTAAADIVKPSPEKKPTAEYSYEFTGWTPEVKDVTGPAVYQANYVQKDRMYKVTFVDDDGTTVIKEAEYKYGTAAADVVKPDDPEKAATAEYTYTFAGWDKDIADVTADVVYTATYTAVKNKYSVVFVDEDGTTVLKAAAEYEYGTKAADIEKPADPTKAATDKFTYEFTGWSPELADVTADATYKAVYKENKTAVYHKISYDLNGGTLDGKTGVITVEAEEGSVITIPDAPTREGYNFLYWKGSEYHPGDKYTVEGDHTFTAQWQLVIKDEPKKDETTKKDKNTPSTGDEADPMLWMAICMLSLSGVIFIKKRKKSN